MSKLSVLVVVALIAVPGCKKKKDGGGSAAKAAEGPALTAEPAVGDITPAEKAPFEAMKFRRLATRNAKGWPKYDAYNLGMKPIKFMAIYGYAYDAAGNQLARTEIPLSWNGDIEPGKKSDFEISVGSQQEAPSGAVAFELCVDSIKFGDDAETNDNARCPDKKAKGK